jgi:hypothetical protein
MALQRNRAMSIFASFQLASDATKRSGLAILVSTGKYRFETSPSKLWLSKLHSEKNGMFMEFIRVSFTVHPFSAVHTPETRGHNQNG